MKNKTNKPVVEIFILLACLLILSANQSEIFTQAQTTCSGPPLWGTVPTKNAWLPGTTVSVVIFDTPDPIDRQIISDGIRKWNAQNVANCSDVTFQSAVAATFPYPNTDPPDGTIWVIRTPERSYMDNHYRNRNTPQQSVKSATMIISDWINHTHSVPNYLSYNAAHETGHSLGLLNEKTNPQISVMGSHFAGPTGCDKEAVGKVYCPPTPTPTPTPSDTCINPSLPDIHGNCPSGSTINENGYCCRSSFCPLECFEPNPECPCYGGGELLTSKDQTSCNREPQFIKAGYSVESPKAARIPECYCSVSPILIDMAGDGFALTDAANGVSFDFNGDGVIKGKISWTSASTDDAWLALDRNSNEKIDNGQELFGNATPQPAPPEGEERHGFLALAEYDKTANGGNLDGEISQQDAIFNQLRLWQDTNHNGVSETNELHTLAESGLRKIELDYRESRKTDEFGNQFKYRAKVRDAQGAQLGRWAWDVFLLTEH